MSGSTVILVAAPCGCAVGFFVCVCAIRQLRPGLFLAGPLAALGAGLSPEEDKAATRAERKEREEKKKKEGQKKRKKLEEQVRKPSIP